MRRGRLLVGLLAGVLGAGSGIVPAAEQSLEGMMPLESGDGATLVMTGYLSRQKFELKGMRIVGSRPVGRSSDPDQFRATLLDIKGRPIGVVRMWSPLLTFTWDLEGLREAAQSEEGRGVDIHIPVSIALDQVILSWPEGKTELARVNVGAVVGEFCAKAPENPACGARKGSEDERR